ncbi:MAG TPA: CopG family antitoxin [Candidatus Kapabacteria bacterium]|nr:CopG family antitoxin [Candidatus Kapabacteria bacterium]
MNKKLKKLPAFKSEDEEFEFWSTHDSTDYVDWSKAIKNPAFPNLKKTEWVTRVVVLPKTLQAKLQKLADQQNLSPQLLAEKFIREGMKRKVA